MVLSRRLLWVTILAGPLAWLVFLQTEYALAAWSCGHAVRRALLYVVAVLLLAITGATTVVGWRWSRSLGGHRHEADPPPSGATAFMAITGLGASALFVLAILAGSIPLLLISPCD